MCDQHAIEASRPTADSTKNGIAYGGILYWVRAENQGEGSETMTIPATFSDNEVWGLLRSEVKRATPFLFRAVLLILLAQVLSACQGKEESSPTGIVGYNHTDTTIVQFLINGGNGDSALRPHQGGGSTSCCVMVPDHWRPGLKVEISWTNDLKNYHKKIVPIPKYEKVGDLTVHFLRNGDVKIFVTHIFLGHPDYPLTGPEAGLRAGEDPVREDWRQQKPGTAQ